MKFISTRIYVLVVLSILAFNVNAAPPIFTCPAVITDVFATSSSVGSFQVNSNQPRGAFNSPVFITDDRSYLLAPALNAEASGNTVILVVQPVSGNDTRCRDVDEPLLLLAIVE